MENINKTLLEARCSVSQRGYVVKNLRTGCIGTACKRTVGSLPDLTVDHAIGCDCLDVGLVALSKHAQRMVKLGLIRRARKFDLVLALKLRSSQLPKELRLQVRRQRRKAIDDGQDERALKVVEIRKSQTLTEGWESLEAYRKRKVWQDW